MAYILRMIMLIFPLLSCSAKDLGIQGHLFPIQEESFLEYLQRQLAALGPDELKEAQEAIQRHFFQALKTPPAVAGLQETTHYRVFYFDPSIRLQKEITDHQGKILIAKGTYFNPLEQVTLDQELLLFDASYESHLAWANQKTSDAKWILVSGRPLALEQAEEHPIYFDQQGVLVKKFHIQHVPAKVTQEGLKLKIEEIPAHEGRG
jgi:conjugal transfer pilus assembly protein TraW